MRRPDGLQLDPNEVAFLDALLVSLVRRCAAGGWTPSPAAESFIRLIRSVAANLAEQTRSAGSTDASGEVVEEPPSVHDLVDTREAGQLLGITPAGVRQLIRRGQLTAYQLNGRWVVAAADVVARAERRAG
ncbi:helix-turn-helix domain-containing protein [Gordonia terrae]|uniref:helix-turn-helix domain-containing protein n=1 Tax=Gordonia hongkongensis TaxID=1701090 RepID=UPI0022B2DD77|nr:helix-turn-helix domain-containing protein [Gordonia terrae]